MYIRINILQSLSRIYKSRTFGFIANHNRKCSGRLSLYRFPSRNVIDTLLTRLLVSLSPRIRNSFRYTKLEGEYIHAHTTLYITHKNAYVCAWPVLYYIPRVYIRSTFHVVIQKRRVDVHRQTVP